jgi:hypothetical protein
MFMIVIVNQYAIMFVFKFILDICRFHGMLHAVVPSMVMAI